MGLGIDITKDAAKQVVGQGLGMIFQGYQERRQVKQQERLNNVQIKGAKEMADYQNMKQLDLWNKTNAEAQIEHYKRAGLNPALMYGASGGGGATTGAGISTGVQGANAADPAAAMSANTGMGLAMAQQRLLEAQTNKTNVEAKKLAGVDTNKVIEETNNIIESTKNISQQTKNAEIAYIGVQLDNKLKEIQNFIKSETTESEIHQIKYKTEAAKQDVNLIINNIRNSSIDAELKEKTIETTIQQYNENLKNTIAETILKKSQNKVNQEQAKAIAENIKIAYLNSDTAAAQVDAQNKNTEYQHEDRVRGFEVDMAIATQQTNAILQAAGISAVAGIANAVNNIAGGFKPKPKPIGYGR